MAGIMALKRLLTIPEVPHILGLSPGWRATMPPENTSPLRAAKVGRTSGASDLAMSRSSSDHGAVNSVTVGHGREQALA